MSAAALQMTAGSPKLNKKTRLYSTQLMYNI